MHDFTPDDRHVNLDRREVVHRNFEGIPVEHHDVRVLADDDRSGDIFLGYLTTAATTCARNGDLQRARVFLAEAERISGMWHAGPWLGAVWEARGVLRAAEGDEVQARAMFREAAEAFERAGNPADAERCLAASRRNEFRDAKTSVS